MLRASSQHAGQDIDLAAIAETDDPDSNIPHDTKLRQFADAVVYQDESSAATLRPDLIDALGMPGFIDTCAVIAGFHGFTRVADATGIEVDEMRAETAKFVEAELGIANPSNRSAAE